jgi:hypothetical protein
MSSIYFSHAAWALRTGILPDNDSSHGLSITASKGIQRPSDDILSPLVALIHGGPLKGV